MLLSEAVRQIIRFPPGWIWAASADWPPEWLLLGGQRGPEIAPATGNHFGFVRSDLSHCNLVLWISKSIFFHIPSQSESMPEKTAVHRLSAEGGVLCEPGWPLEAWPHRAVGSLLSCGLRTWLRSQRPSHPRPWFIVTASKIIHTPKTPDTLPQSSALGSLSLRHASIWMSCSISNVPHPKPNS